MKNDTTAERNDFKISDVNIRENINLLKKSIFTALSNISNSKKVKKEISVIDNYCGLLNYFERNAIWS